MVKLKKGLCILLAAAMMTTCFVGCDNKKEDESKVQDEESTESDASDKLEEALAQQLSFDKVSDADKEETVYVMADASGNVEKILVSSWLKNTEGTDGINDYTKLTNIENVKGYEQYVKNDDGSITWQANGADIYYQGESNEQLPVDVKVSYKLNGVDVKPEELKGTSGKVTIRFDYINNTRTTVKVGNESKEVITPFVMMSGVILPVDRFTNVEINNGKIISEGNNAIVVGYAVPGLKNCLLEGIDEDNIKGAIEDIDVPEYVEITADVTDFELDMTMTAGVADLLSSDDIKLDIDTTQLTSSLDTLSDSSNQLVDGSYQLATGLDTLTEGTYSLKTGSNQLKTGADDLAKYTSQLADGTDKLNSALTTYTKGANKIKKGSYKLKNGAEELSKGANDVKQGIDSVYDGEEELKTGLDAIVLGYEGNSEQTGAVDGANSLSKGASELSKGAKDLSDGANALSTGVSTLVQTMSGMPDMIAKTASDIIGMTGLGSLDNISAAMAQLESAATNGGLTAEQMATYKQLSQAYYSASAIMQVSDTLRDNLNAMSTDIAALEDGALAVADGAQDLSDGATQVSKGASDVSKGVTTLYKGTVAVSDGLSDLMKGTYALKTGAKNLADGAGTINSKMKELYKGSVNLSKGSGKLLSATDTLNTSAKAISDGADTLSNGADSLNEGVITLDDGAVKLDTGANDLMDGMNRFNEEGIKKLTDKFQGNYQADIDFINALFKENSSYGNYSGAINGIKTNVKFIYETGAIR